MLQVSNGDKKLQKKKKRISHLRKQFNSMCLYSLYKQPKDHQKERLRLWFLQHGRCYGKRCTFCKIHKNNQHSYLSKLIPDFGDSTAILNTIDTFVGGTSVNLGLC